MTTERPPKPDATGISITNSGTIFRIEAEPAASAERSIVERLAAMQEPLCESGYGDTDCALCGAHRPYDQHDKDCPWQAARDLVGST